MNILPIFKSLNILPILKSLNILPILKSFNILSMFKSLNKLPILKSLNILPILESLNKLPILKSLNPFCQIFLQCWIFYTIEYKIFSILKKFEYTSDTWKSESLLPLWPKEMTTLNINIFEYLWSSQRHKNRFPRKSAKRTREWHSEKYFRNLVYPNQIWIVFTISRWN